VSDTLKQIVNLIRRDEVCVSDFMRKKK